MLHRKFAHIFYLKASVLVTLIIVTIIILGGLLFTDRFFRIKKIKVLGITLDKKLRGLDLIKNQNLFFLDPTKLGSDLKNDNPTVDMIDIQKSYPQTLVLIVTFSQPVGLLEVDSGYFLMDKGAKILQKMRRLPQTDLPLIHYYQKLDYESYQAGNLINYQDIKTILYLSQAISLAQIPIAYIDIASNDMILCKVKDPNNGQLLFSQKKDMNAQIYELQMIIRQLKIEGKSYQKIDLRFDKPVITY